MSTQAPEKKKEDQHDYAGEVIMLGLKGVLKVVLAVPRVLAWLALWVFVASPTSEQSHWMLGLVIVCIPLFVLTVLSRWVPAIGWLLPWRDLDNLRYGRGPQVLYDDLLTKDELSLAKDIVGKWSKTCDKLGLYETEVDDKDGTSFRVYPPIVAVVQDLAGLRVHVKPIGAQDPEDFVKVASRLQVAWNVRGVQAMKATNANMIEFVAELVDPLEGVRHAEGAIA